MTVPSIEPVGSLNNISSNEWQETVGSLGSRKIYVIESTKEIFFCNNGYQPDEKGSFYKIEEIQASIMKRETPQLSNEQAQSTNIPALLTSDTTTQEEKINFITANDKHWRAEYDELQHDLEEKRFDETATKYPFLRISIEAFTTTQTQDLKNKILNIFVNRKYLELEINTFVRNNIKQIVKEFNNGLIESIGQLTFEIEFKGKETHNGGKLPAKIIFYKNKEEVFSVMYKPRAAQLDREVLKVLETFGFTAYKILSFPDQNKSIWQYIDGKQMQLDRKEQHQIKRTVKDADLDSPEAYIEYAITDKRQQNILKTTLHHLNELMKRLHISDLHGENVILGNDGNIYLIDLEVIDFNQHPLLLMRQPENTENPELTPEQLQTIDSFQKTVGTEEHFNIPVRIVLVTSGLLLPGLQSDLQNAATKATDLVIGSLQAQGYQCDEKVVFRYIYNDFLNGDVPFFTKIGSMIYFGHPSGNESNVIGKK